MKTYPRGDEYVVVPPQSGPSVEFTPQARGEESSRAHEESPYPPVDLGLGADEVDGCGSTRDAGAEGVEVLCPRMNNHDRRK